MLFRLIESQRKDLNGRIDKKYKNAIFLLFRLNILYGTEFFPKITTIFLLSTHPS